MFYPIFFNPMLRLVRRRLRSSHAFAWLTALLLMSLPWLQGEKGVKQVHERRTAGNESDLQHTRRRFGDTFIGFYVSFFEMFWSQLCNSAAVWPIFYIFRFSLFPKILIFISFWCFWNFSETGKKNVLF